MKLIKILTDKIQIKSNDSDFAKCHINDLIKISDGETTLVTMVSALTDTDAEQPLEDDDFLSGIQTPSVKNIECNIIGSIVDGRFTNSIDHYPTTAVTANLIDGAEFSGMLQSKGADECFCIGNYSSYGTPAYINGNKLYQRHSCIVGNTGSGKSETLVKIIEETASATNCNIIIFDIHGEYSGLSYVDSIKMGEVPFPIWMLGFADMVTNVLKVKEDSTVVMSALRKVYHSYCKDKNEGKPIYFDFRWLLKGLKTLNTERIATGEFYKTGDKAGQAKTTNGDYNGKLAGIINAMETLYSDKRYSFLFVHEPQEYLSEFFNRIMGGGKPVKNIDLSGVPHDIAVLIIGAITKLIYNIQIMQKDARPITFVCDEAHVYIPTDFQLSASQRRMVEIFENIAKEGRKFGITLMVASQRPSELNKTIMAQCANYIVMKLNNENDKTMMKGVMAEGSSGVIESTTMFSPGDCIVIGDAAPIPLKIHVELAKERPQSRTIDFWTDWQQERKNVDYGELIEEYLEN